MAGVRATQDDGAPATMTPGLGWARLFLQRQASVLTGRPCASTAAVAAASGRGDDDLAETESASPDGGTGIPPIRHQRTRREHHH